MLGPTPISFGREYYQRQICFNQTIFARLSQIYFKMKALEGLTCLLVQLLKKLQVVRSVILVLKKEHRQKICTGSEIF